MVVSFINPHDIMSADANTPGQPPVQKPLGPVLTPPPANSIYASKWKFTSPPGIKESLTAPGMPSALSEYHKGWSGSLGYIPADRSDMWDGLYHYYLNLIRDNDRGQGCPA
jgi:arylsulfatase